MKKLVHSFIILLTAFLLLPPASRAQLVLHGNQSATVLANTLVGSGITILAPTLTCYGAANATFTTGAISPIGIANGIVLTTGAAVDTTTPLTFGSPSYGVGDPASDFASEGWGTPGDADLTTLSGNTTNDACVLEFDMVPAGDTIKFNYVFGSEEYTSFTCTEFNDAFGFFISGPGISGLQNIALVPGTTIPVCINSVNCSSGSLCTAFGAGAPFCAYYINNNSTTSPAHPYVVYDGLTTVLTAISAVTPCDTYHLKLAIADAGDDIYDSGVFIQGGSLTSTGISVTPQGINPSDTGFGAQYCVRECTPGEFIFHALGNLSDSTVIHFIIGGTAVNGYDYTAIADSIVIPAYDSTYTLNIYGLPVTAAGPKTVELFMYSLFSCGGLPVIIDSAEMTIYDSLYVAINTPDTAICLGQNVHFDVSGSSSLAYTWSPAASLDNAGLEAPTATPTVTTTYVVSALYPGSGCAPSTDNVTVQVIEKPVLNVGPSIQSICLGVPLQIGVTTTPTGTFAYNWTPATYLSDSTIANPVVTPGAIGDTEYVVTVGGTVPGCSISDSFLLHVLPNNFTLTSPDTNICFSAGPFQIIASGDTEFYYTWTPATGVSNDHIIDPTISPAPGSATYVITASYPGCPDMTHSITYNIQDPNVNILIGDTSFCIGSTLPIPVEVTPAGLPYTFVWSSPTTGLSNPDIIDPNFFMPTEGTYTYTLTITSSLGCTSTDSVTFHTAPPIHIDITPGATTIPFGSSIQLSSSEISVPASPLFYYWYPDNGTLNNPNISDPIATPVDSATTYTVIGINSFGCRDSASETIFLDENLTATMPLAFTPNNDGLNDVFRIINPAFHQLVEFSIFNRWGEKIYDNTTDISKGWDGTYHGVPQDMGVYNYLIVVAGPEGTNKTYTGTVTLIR